MRMIDPIIRRAAIALLTAMMLAVTGCGRSERAFPEMDLAENLMEARPDSALSILSSIDSTRLSGDEAKARYALLMSMALDKNYIDTTNFSVLQPAIDYYLDNGTPDEKLRTYYYQGVIFLNKGERDKALKSFTKGMDISSYCEDSLYIAKTLVAQGAQYFAFYDYDSYTNCHLRAARIYHKLSRKWHEFDCLLNALNGTTSAGNKTKGDSILSICYTFNNLDSAQSMAFINHQLSYAGAYNDIEKITNLIPDLEENPNLDSNSLLNLASSYDLLGNDVKAKHILDSVYKRQQYDTLKFLAIAVPVLENMGKYKDALAAYKEYSHTWNCINTLRFEQKSKSVEERHKLELKAEQEAEKHTIITWGFISGILFLMMVVVILFLLFRSNKTEKELAIKRTKISELENKQLKTDNEIALQRAQITELDNQRLKSERENLVLENKNLELERDKKALEAENLAHRVETLENESISLKNLINAHDELPSAVQQTIKERIDMLNTVIARYITDNDRYKRSYETWIKELTENTEDFMNCNRQAFQASHPRFIQYFEKNGLTESEINYVCLYAIGLKGKEVGDYIKKRGHVNISSAIRRKLGIDKHETNIGIYVRRLLKEL